MRTRCFGCGRSSREVGRLMKKGRAGKGGQNSHSPIYCRECRNKKAILALGERREVGL